MSATGTRAALSPPTRPAHFGPPDALRTVWTRPRATIRWILDHGDRGLWVALLLGGAATWGIHRAAFTPFAFAGLHRVPLLVAPVHLVEAGLLFLALALVVTGAGRALGGISGLHDVVRALAWTSAPIAASAPFVALAALLDGGPAWLLLVAAVLWLWAMVLAVFGIAEAHRFPAPRATLVLVLGLGTVAVLHGALVLALALLPAPGSAM
jgi:hypothetical protein